MTGSAARYILKRAGVMICMLALASLFTFCVLQTLGVDPIAVLGGEKGVDAAARLALEKAYGLDRPLLVRYGDWIGGLFTGDLGLDYVNRQNVAALIAPRIPVTVGLTATGILLGCAVGVPLGIFAALKKNTAADAALSIFSLLCASTPSFVAGILVVIACAKFFPGYAFVGGYGNAAEYFARLFPPAFVLSLIPMALTMRITRSSMIEQMKQGYIRTARAKGLSPFGVVCKHGLRNAAPPVLTVASMMVGTAIAGAALVETVFSLPGLGSLLIAAIKEFNYPVTQTLVLILLFVFLFLSFILDVLYVLIDPRVGLKRDGAA
jgi:ABC-type dipeptide/oligopeptide/nickel transport system permease component